MIPALELPGRADPPAPGACASRGVAMAGQTAYISGET